MNRFLRFFVGSGRLPEHLRAELARTDVILLEEGLSGSVTYRHYRAPGRRSNWRKDAAAGAVAVTANRLLVWAGHFKHIDVPLDHPVRTTIEVVAERPDRVCFAYDAGTTNPAKSGRVEVRLRTDQAERIARLLAR